jgi:DNA-binding transcriptional LysR family regulator
MIVSHERHTLRAVVTDHAVTLIPGLAVAAVCDDIVLRPLGPDAPCRRVVAVLPAGYCSPAVGPFVEILRREADAHCVSCTERARPAAVAA